MESLWATAATSLCLAPACRVAQQSDAEAELPGFFVLLKDSSLQQPLQQPLEEQLGARPPLQLSQIIQAKVLLKGAGKAVTLLQVDRGDRSEKIVRVRRGQWGRKDLVGRNMTDNPCVLGQGWGDREEKKGHCRSGITRTAWGTGNEGRALFCGGEAFILERGLAAATSRGK